MTYDIITIGSATRDVYLKSNVFRSVPAEVFQTGKGLCVPAGAKIPVEELHFTTGGSAVNTAVTFSQQGLKTGVVAKLGDDSRAASVKERLKEVGADTRYLIFDAKQYTAYSVVIHSESGERTIFVYRGASSHLNADEFPFDVFTKTKWIFITHLGGESSNLFKPLIEKAQECKVRVALNPGSTQLAMGSALIPFLDHVDILFLNQEEAAILTGVDFKNEDALFEKLDQWVKGIAVMTRGADGVVVSDGITRWEAPALKEPVFVDRTGAGDAFASGFTTAIIRGETIEDAIQLGSANATSKVGTWGANQGLLTKNDSAEKFGKLSIQKVVLQH